jgi:hypothetical protein
MDTILGLFKDLGQEAGLRTGLIWAACGAYLLPI